MKTSNKLIIGLFASILLITIAVLLSIRFTGKLNNQMIKNKRIENIDFESCKYLELENFNNLHIVYSDSSYLELSYYNDSLKIEFDKETKGDSLKLKPKDTELQVQYILHIKSNITKLSITNSSVDLQGGNEDTIHISLNNSNLRTDYPQKSNQTFNKIDIISIQSNLYLSLFIKELSIDLKEESNFELNENKIKKLTIVKDETSKLSIY